MDEELEVEEQEDVRIIFLGEKDNITKFTDAAFETKTKKEVKFDYDIMKIYIKKKKVNLAIHPGITDHIKNFNCENEAIVYVFDWEEKDLSNKIAENRNTVKELCPKAIEAIIFIKSGEKLKENDLKDKAKKFNIPYCYSVNENLTELDDQLIKIIQKAMGVSGNGCCDCCFIY